MFKKLTKKGIKKGLFRGTIFALVAGATLFGAYTLTPSKKRVVELNSSTEQVVEEPTMFNKFLTKVTDSFEDEEEEFGLKASLTDLEITWPTKDGLSLNDIKIDGDLNLIMRSLTDLDFTVDLSANYNGRSLDAAIGYVNGDIFLALQDLRIKSSKQSTIDFLEYIKWQFFDPANPDGLGIDINLETFINEKLGGLDFSSLLGGISLPTTTETIVGDEVIIDLKMDDINLSIVLDKNTLNIKKVDLGTLKLGDVTISGLLNCDTISEVIALDDPTYPKQRGEFKEVISYIGWVDRILELLKTRKFGFNFTTQISLNDENTGETKLMDLEASINVDASDVIDFNNLVLGGDEENVGRPEGSNYESRTPTETIINKDGKLEFGAHISLKGQSGEEYSNIDISFFDNVGYLTFNQTSDNDAVMKAKIDLSTISSLLEKLPDLITSFTQTADVETNDGPQPLKALGTQEASSSLDDLLSFITSNDLISGITNGDYSAILDVIKEISNDDKGINLKLNLAPLGLGHNSEIGIALDSTKGIEEVLDLEINNVEIGSANISAKGNTSEYSSKQIEIIKSNKETYDDMSFTNSVIEQVSDILSTKTGLLTLEGSLLDSANEGIVLNGKAQFDANEKVGYGSVTLRQYSSELVNSNKYLDHKIDFDINDNGVSENTRNMHFAYNDNLKAKITTVTVTDIIDLVKDLLNSDDERFTKFSGMLQEMLLGTAISKIISTKDFLELAKPSYLKSIKQINNGNTISVVIAGDTFGMESDICANLNFRNVNGQQKIESLEIVNFVILGKTLNVKVGLYDYDNSYVSPINFEDNFMDFSQVKVLLDFGINTTKLNYYHLTAAASLKLGSLRIIDFDLDFHIHVDGKKTRVYGSIPKVPWITDIVSADIATTSINTEFVFEPTEDIGGIFHIVRNEDHALWGKDEVNYYQADSKSFLEGIIDYLAIDMLNVNSNLLDSFSDGISTEKSFDPDYSKLFTDTGFNYSYDPSTGNNTWNVGINMNQILGNNSLGALELTLNGKDVGKSGLFTTAHVEMSLVSLVKISADITLVDPTFENETWPDEIETKYNKVLSWYSNMSANDKARFDSEYKNNPSKTWRAVEQSRYF